ncbi:MAG: DUF1080 domain-containing protein [Candidatus Hydrogenedentes bacterium]|nr:DUF1080 domain-containing protein [Candidatus Hydrogenedentota bacterium]
MLPIRSSVIMCLCATTCLMLCAAVACAAGPEDVYPDEADPFVGDYKGRWTGDVSVDPDVAAQVIARGRGRYQIRVVSKLDIRCPPVAIVEAEAKRGRISFEVGGTRCEIRDGHIIGKDKDGNVTVEMKKVVRLSPTLGAPAPAGAIVLFDGSNFDAWDGTKGWELLDNGVAMVTPKGGYLQTKQHFTDLELHVEFRNSFMPNARGQERSNSGVFVQDIYEVQVLDSYGLEGYYNECGALYKVAAPQVNACAPPLQWQTYDIEYRAARFDAKGELSENPRITVRHNGVLIHNDQELWWITAWTEEERLKPPPREPGPIKFQGHNNYVQYRNIWLVDLAAGE